MRIIIGEGIILIEICLAKGYEFLVKISLAILNMLAAHRYSKFNQEAPAWNYNCVQRNLLEILLFQRESRTPFQGVNVSRGFSAPGVLLVRFSH